MNQPREFLKINPKKGVVKAFLKSVNFQEEGSFIVYIPSLNLSAYGDTLEEAHEMMKDIVLPDYCGNILKKKQALVFEELNKLGWKRSSIFTNELSKSSHVDKEGILRDFDLSPETVIEEYDIAV